jgi:hypothetical protein
MFKVNGIVITSTDANTIFVESKTRDQKKFEKSLEELLKLLEIFGCKKNLSFRSGGNLVLPDWFLDACKKLGVNVLIKNKSNRELFWESLTTGCPKETATAIYEAFAELPEAVHHTKTNGGDLRIRALNAPRRRNIFTMYWQPKSQLFSCRINLSPENVGGAGMLEVNACPEYEPLPSSFKFDCSQPGAIENLVRLIKRSLQNI